MSIAAIQPIGAEPLELSFAGASANAATPSPVAGRFENWLVDQVEQTDAALGAADAAVRDLALGRAQNLHEVMLAVEDASLALNLVVQVRNRLLESYQEIMRMQI